MPLLKTGDVLRLADSRRQAVIAFNCFDSFTIRWAVAAAEAERRPVILMLYPPHGQYMPFEMFARAAMDAAERSAEPVALHLDHCRDMAEIDRALAAGFRSVMYDGSALPFAENARLSAQVVAKARRYGAEVEAELGCVGQADDASAFTDASRYTLPGDAARFVQETGVDFLAVAIGSAHGNYVSTPRLDIPRLSEIDAAVSCPLVLHGGTGIPDGQLRAAIVHGINKINVATEYQQVLYGAIAEEVRREGAPARRSVLELADAIEPSILAYLRGKLRLAWNEATEAER